jgi:hypothetical protein
MIDLNANFWQERYDLQQTGWDLGTISPPLKAYFDQLTDKSIRILIPGAGNAHEAAYLHQLGFSNVFVVDLVQDVLDAFKRNHPSFNPEHLICANFFDLTGKFDLIVEQTFFCAIDPSLRAAYALKMSELLSDQGTLVGLLFDRSFEGGPPFGGNSKEYMEYFNAQFKTVKIDPCYNSAKPRDGAEVFIQVYGIKKDRSTDA